MRQSQRQTPGPPLAAAAGGAEAFVQMLRRKLAGAALFGLTHAR